MVDVQVALDFTRIEDALPVVSALCSASKPPILEVGTPLIKAEGMRSVRIVKSVCGRSPISADTKTMDTGALEAMLAAEAGADMATVLAAADMATIVEFVEEARRRGMMSAVDTIGVDKPLERVRLIVDHVMPDIVVFHLGIDVQTRRGANLEALVEEAKKAASLGPRIAVAGGVDAKAASLLSELDIVIVGRYITRAHNPLDAYRELLTALHH